MYRNVLRTVRTHAPAWLGRLLRRVVFAPVTRATVGIAALVGIFLLLGRRLVANWSDIAAERLSFAPLPSVVAVVLGIVAILVVALAWTTLVAALSRPKRPVAAGLTLVFLYSWLGRNVPGRVAELAGQFYMGRSLGLSSSTLIGGIAYHHILLLVTAAVFVSLTLIPSLAAGPGIVSGYVYVPVVALAGLALLHPRVLRQGAKAVMRFRGRAARPPDWGLPPRVAGALIGLYLTSYLLMGVAFYSVIRSLTPYPLSHLPLAAGAYAFAMVLGRMAFLVPAGLGVREGALVALLQFTMPVELAVLSAFASRIWTTVLDLLLFVGCLGYDHLSGKRVLLKALRGEVAQLK